MNCSPRKTQDADISLTCRASNLDASLGLYWVSAAAEAEQWARFENHPHNVVARIQGNSAH